MPPCHGGGRGFESRPVRKNWLKPALIAGFLFFAFKKNKAAAQSYAELKIVGLKWVFQEKSVFWFSAHYYD
jgi:hypothetical protein